VLFINDFTLSSIQHVAVKFNRNRVRSRDRFLSRTFRDFPCVDWEAYTVDKNSRFPFLFCMVQRLIDV